ncbi:MAG: 1-(5-phosphoribosyl)-5-((5-phosphoribosylamino) methylideneamino) imidazole-4-carboxamide isomerase [Caulobacteraceae bacterium]|nr:1-(5-phosphoribosyl)-5-((5-phosphoribosylamino) methylideneamino) imidazole-4-carboxamide isomerase [Caulobacteraceae bacterium]
MNNGRLDRLLRLACWALFAVALAALAGTLTAPAPAAGQVRISSLPAAATLTGTEILPGVQGGANVAITVGQVKAFAGGGGTPGGVSGQLQYDNAGVFGGFTLAGDCTIAVPTITCLKTNGVSFGTAATQNTGVSGAVIGLLNGNNTESGALTFSGSVAGSALSTYLASPPAIGGAVAGAGTFSSLKDTGVTGSAQCLHVDTTGALTGTGADCAGATSPGGVSGNVQYNNGGVFGGIANLTLTSPASAATFTLAGGKTLTVNNTLTLTGTDATTMTFPTTSATIARTDAAQSFTGVQTLAGLIDSALTATAQVCADGSKNLTATCASVAASYQSFTTGATNANFFNAPTNATYKVNGVLAWNAASPAVTAGGGLGTATVTNAAGTASGLITAGTTAAGTFVMTFINAASHGYACTLNDITSNASFTIGQTAFTTTSATFQPYSRTTGATAALTTGDTITYQCTGF